MAPFGATMLALNPQTQTLCDLAPPNAFVLDGLQRGETRAEIVADYADFFPVDSDVAAGHVDGIVAEFWKEKLFDGDPDRGDNVRPGAGATPGPGAGLAERAAPPFLAEPALDMVLSCGGPQVRVLCEDPDIARLVEAATAPASRIDKSKTPPPLTISLAGQGGNYTINIDGDVESDGPAPPTDRATARSTLMREIIGHSVARRPPSVLLHATAVEIDGGCVILAAPSGSGKSTLAASLVAAGGRLVADDILPLSADGDTVVPVPAAISVKSGSWPLLGADYPELDGLPVFQHRGINTKYLWPGPDRTSNGPVRPTAIIFITRSEGAPVTGEGATCEDLRPVCSAKFLIKTGSQIRGLGEEGFAAFARFALTCPAYTATYATLAEGIDMVRRVARA